METGEGARPDVVTAAVEAWLARHPVEATYLGDHRFDDQLDDPSAEAAARRASELRAQLDAMQSLTPDGPDRRVDLAVLGTELRAELLQLDRLDEAAWNPMLHNPGLALYLLAARPFAAAAERYASLRARLAAVPDYLAAARTRLAGMSRVHLETAITQLDGTLALLDTLVPDLAAQAGESDDVAAHTQPARAALQDHRTWLADRRDSALRDPRLGTALFAAKLELALDTAFDPAELLDRAEADLRRVTAEIVAEAGRLAEEGSPDAGTVHRVLADLAADAPTDATILQLCRDALAETTAFVRERDLVTVFDDPIDVVEMPEIDRGVAVAYCRPPGPLEQVTLATELAVSPAPADWPAERVASFYREYNAHMLHNLVVHEAMPGHALQLMHSKRCAAAGPVRRMFWSGSFVEGWAVYSEELLAGHGYRGGAKGSALRMQQLKMQLRMIINTILDIRFHCAGLGGRPDLDEAAAMALMTEQGFQEEGEAAGKWRRVQLTSTQLCTYYVGYCEVKDLADDVRAARPQWSAREVHDALLAHGSPPARHLRTLLLD